MLKQELIHSHILVAILCGWEPQKPNKEFPNGWMTLDDEVPHVVSNDDILEELPYQTDWNYLMAAWEELQKIEIEDTEADDELTEISAVISDAILAVDINLAFKEIVRAIDKINQSKLQET